MDGWMSGDGWPDSRIDYLFVLAIPLSPSLPHLEEIRTSFTASHSRSPRAWKCQRLLFSSGTRCGRVVHCLDLYVPDICSIFFFSHPSLESGLGSD